ncbi:MAG: glycosyltransferase [Alphaproteobacteria bacterium]|nr:glycosyltransferase [Alphaproteobacteria bacterium]
MGGGPGAAPQAGVTPARRIAILVSARRIASRERIFLDLARRLITAGDRVTILAVGPEAALRAALPEGADLHDVAPGWTRGSPHLMRMYLSIAGLTRYLRAETLDLLFTTSIPPNLVGLMASRLLAPRPKVIVRHSNVLERAWRPRNRLVPALYPMADAVIAVSEAAAADVRRFGVAPGRITVIPNGIDLARAATAGPAPHPWFGDGAGPVVVALGRLVPQKDYPTLLHAFATVRSRTGARLVVLGEGPLRARLVGQARELRVAEAIAFAGHVADPFPYLAAADLLVLASRSEGMPSALIEGLACGCPIVATDSPGGTAEILDGGRFGRLVAVGDWAAMAEAMAATLAEPREPRRLKERATCFDLHDVVCRYQAVVDAVIAGRRA